MQYSERTDAGAPDDDNGNRRGIRSPLSIRALPLTQVLRPFTRTGGFYARSWATYLDRQPDELPVTRPTFALAAQALSDEIVLLGFHLLRSAPDAMRLERIHREVIAALELYGGQGWLQEPEKFFAAPPPLTDPSIRAVSSMGRTYERIFFDSEYEPSAGEPGRDRWLSYAANSREYGLMLRHREPRPWLVCIHGAEMGRAALDLRLFRAWHLHQSLGLNVVLPVLPMHGPRARGLPKGAAFPSEDVLDNVHGVAQAVWGVRRLLCWIRSQQPESPIALNGISLGGYLTSLIASLEDNLTCAIVSIPLADLVELVARHAGVSDYLDLRNMLTSAKPISRMISPLGLTPRVPVQGRFICAGIADRLVRPRDEATRLWEHWDRPEICWFPGSHTGFFGSRAVQRFIDGALVRSGLADATRSTSEGNP
jgi:pimeloyl-ACP methyl ester carboxylesterase